MLRRQGRSMTSILLAAVVMGGGYYTNLELIESTVGEACSELMVMMDENGVDTVSINIEGDHAAGWLVEQTATTVLDSHGYTVVNLGRDETGPVELRIRTMDLAVRYGDTSRPWIFGRKMVDRVAVCELSAQLVSRDGSIMSSVRASAGNTDRVPVSELDVLTGPDDWSWLGEGEIGGGGGGILEPLVVTGVVASLIYLFYSSRAE
jgi:hypothetical protein